MFAPESSTVVACTVLVSAQQPDNHELLYQPDLYHRTAGCNDVDGTTLPGPDRSSVCISEDNTSNAPIPNAPGSTGNDLAYGHTGTWQPNE